MRSFTAFSNSGESSPAAGLSRQGRNKGRWSRLHTHTHTHPKHPHTPTPPHTPPHTHTTTPRTACVCRGQISLSLFASPLFHPNCLHFRSFCIIIRSDDT